MRQSIAILLLLALPGWAAAANLVVLEARGGGLAAGQSIPSDKPINLKEGERVTVIGPDGKSVTLRGPFSGPPMPGGAAARRVARGHRRGRPPPTPSRHLPLLSPRATPAPAASV